MKSMKNELKLKFEIIFLKLHSLNKKQNIFHYFIFVVLNYPAKGGCYDITFISHQNVGKSSL